MKIINLILILIIIILSPHFIFSEKDYHISCEKHIVSLFNINTIELFDLEKLKIRKKRFDFNIVLMEVCDKYPFIFFIGEKKTNDEKIIERNNYLFNIENFKTKRLIGNTDINEKRWSKDGEYFYYNLGNSFKLIETKNLENYIQSIDEQQDVIEIKGHPLGLIWQENWIGSYLFYSSGIGGGAQCYGVYNLKKKQNYLIKCCGMRIKYTDPCNKNKDFKEIINFLIKEGKLKKISTDFYKEVKKIVN